MTSAHESDGIASVRTGRVALRPPTTDDAEAFHRVESDVRLWTLYPELCPATRTETDEKLEWMIEHWNAHGFGTWLVELDGVVVGSGGPRFHDLDGEQVVNVYYRISPDAQGLGIATSIVDAVLAMAPRVAPGVAVVIRTDPRNVAARRVAEKCGFSYVGDEPHDSYPLVVYRRHPHDVQMNAQVDAVAPTA